MTDTTEKTTAETTERDVLELVGRWVDAERRGDGAALDRLGAGEFRLVGPVGFVLDRAQWVSRFDQSGGLAIESLEWSDSTVRLFGDTAIVIGVQDQKATYGAQRSDWRLRATVVCVREGGEWKLASVHYSAIGAPL